MHSVHVSSVICLTFVIGRVGIAVGVHCSSLFTLSASSKEDGQGTYLVMWTVGSTHFPQYHHWETDYNPFV